MAAAICRQYVFRLRYEVLSISLQSSFFVIHFRGLLWMCLVCQGRRAAVSGPPVWDWDGLALCFPQFWASKKKKKSKTIFKFWNNFRLRENLGKCNAKHSCILFLQMPKCWHFTVRCYHSLSVSMLLLLLVKPFESKLQTWCPFTPEHLCVYFLKNNAIFYNQYSY